jgi:hypothetical protein
MPLGASGAPFKRTLHPKNRRGAWFLCYPAAKCLTNLLLCDAPMQISHLNKPKADFIFPLIQMFPVVELSQMKQAMKHYLCK